MEAKIRTGQTLANNSKSPLPLLEVSDTNHSVEAISADIFNETTAAVLRRRSISEEENTKKTFELLLKVDLSYLFIVYIPLSSCSM